MGARESVLEPPSPGEVYWAFDGTGGKRPFVVVSRADLNRGNYFLAVPFTTGRIEARRHLPTCVHFSKGAFGLPKECVAQADALTQLRRSDLAEPTQKLGTLSQATLQAIITAIGYVLEAECRHSSVPTPPPQLSSPGSPPAVTLPRADGEP